MQDMVFRTILELCLNCREKIGENEFKLLFSFLENNFRQVKTDQLQIMTEAVLTICAALPLERLPMAIE
jgi:tRNA/tmRNA/rRNA uracil-C5-methylase (TrmA/RlmC/RlmD family)